MIKRDVSGFAMGAKCATTAMIILSSERCSSGTVNGSDLLLRSIHTFNAA